MSHKHHKGKFNKKGKKNKNGGGSNIGHGNFDDIMKGFVIMTDRDREKNAVSDANNFLIPIIEELYPRIYEGSDIKISKHDIIQKKLKTENEQEQKEQQQQQEQATDLGEKEEQIESNQNEDKEKEQQDQQDNDQQQEQEQEGDDQNEEQEEENDEEKDENKEKETEEAKQGQTETANDRLEKELNDLKQQKDKLLYNVNTDVKCTVFLKVNSKLMGNLDVTNIVEHIMQKVHVEKNTLTRFCHRMYPAEYAFRADEANLKKYMELLIKERITTEAPSSWMLECKSRNNSKFNRKNVLDIVSSLMPKIHFVDYKVPFYTIVVDICHILNNFKIILNKNYQNLMCLSILKNYNDYKKYSVKVNPQLNNQKDYSFLNQNKHPPKVVVPVTEEQLKEMEQKQEEQRAQLRAEQIIKNDEEDDIDLI